MRVDDDVVEFLGRPARAGKPRGPWRQRARRAGPPQLARDRYARGIVGQVIAVEPRQKVSHVAKPLVADAAAESGGCIHPVGHADHVLVGRGVRPQKTLSLDPGGDLHTGHVERRGADAKEVDEVPGRAAGVAPSRQPDRLTKLLGHVNDERHAKAVVGERPLAAGDALAVISPEDHDGRVGEAVGGELVEDPPHIAVEGRGQIEPMGEGRANHRRVGIERGHGERRWVGPAVGRQRGQHLRQLVSE